MKFSDTQLTPQLEADLAARIAMGDATALNALALAVMGWVESAAYKWSHYGVAQDDLVSEAFIAVLKAAATFDASKGRFTTHVKFPMNEAFRGLIAAQGGPVSISVNMARAGQAARQDSFFEASPALVAAEAAWRSTAALDAPSGLDDGSSFGANQTSQARLVDDVVADGLDVLRMLASLPADEQTVLSALYEFDDAVSGPGQKEIAAAMGVSQARVSQLKSSALAKLRMAAVA